MRPGNVDQGYVLRRLIRRAIRSIRFLYVERDANFQTANYCSRFGTFIIDRFAGAYPYLQDVLSVEPEVFVQRRERGPQLELAAALASIRKQYGATLFTGLAAYHGDFLAVWERVVGRKHNQALVDAGVLMVSHE